MARQTRSKTRAEDLETERRANNVFKSFCTNTNECILSQLSFHGGSLENVRNFMLAAGFTPAQVRLFWLSDMGDGLFTRMSKLPVKVMLPTPEQSHTITVVPLEQVDVRASDRSMCEPEANESVDLFALSTGSSYVLIVVGKATENICDYGCWCTSRSWRNIFCVVPGEPPIQLLVGHGYDQGQTQDDPGWWTAPLRLFNVIQHALSVTPEFAVAAIIVVLALVDPVLALAKFGTNIDEHNEAISAPLAAMQECYGPGTLCGPSCQNAMTYTLEVIQELVSASDTRLVSLYRALNLAEPWDVRVTAKVAAARKLRHKQHMASQMMKVQFIHVSSLLSTP